MVFNKPEEYAQMSLIILKQTLNNKDLNADNVIDFDEFIGQKANRHDKEWVTITKKIFYKEYDKNGDGVLADNEILSWIIPNIDAIALEEVNHLFASTGDNLADALSFEDIIKNHEQFVGSKHTDFGKNSQNTHVPEEL